MVDHDLGPEHRAAAGLARVARALETGARDRRHGHLRALADLGVGLRLLLTELG